MHEYFLLQNSATLLVHQAKLFPLSENAYFQPNRKLLKYI